MNLECSCKFYQNLFGLVPLLKQEGNTILSEGLVLQDVAIWESSIQRTVARKHYASLLYFEESDWDSFMEKLSRQEPPIEYLTPLTTLEDGRKLIRFFDPDGNLIEVRSCS